MALPSDDMELISKKLTFAPNYTRFRSARKAWRSAAPKQSQVPWLIAIEDDADDCSKFYQFSFEANKFTQIPELSRPSLLSSLIDNSHVIIRSSHGWLFLLDLQLQSVSLINPLTDSIINLLNLHFEDYFAFAHDIRNHKFGFSLTSGPGESLPDCFALIYYDARISYCKVGSSVWNEMQHPEIYSGGKIHICCYSGKHFLASAGDVFACEFGDNPSVYKLVSLSLNDDELGFQDSRLVESNGDLLLVLVLDIRYRTCKVFKVEFGQQQAKLVELKSLGDRTFFLSLDTTFSLVASKYTGCKKYSIYIPEFLGRFSDQTIIPTLVIHDCKEVDSRIISSGYVPSRVWFWIHCAWFTPSLLM